MTTIYKTTYGSLWNSYSRQHAMSQLTEQELLDYNMGEHQLNVQPSSYTIEFTVTPTLLKYKITDAYNSILEQAKIKLESIKAHHKFYAQSFFTAKYVEQSSEYEYQTTELVNLLAESYISKRPTLKPPVNPNIQTDVYLPFEIFFPAEVSTFENCKIRVQGCDTNTVIVKLNGSTVQPTIGDNWKSLLSQVTLSTSSTNFAAGDIIPVTVTATDQTLEYVMIEQDVGVIDRITVKLTNGSGKFNILTETLETGDIVSVYAGFKKYTKAAELKLTLN
jgi:hypothetical protein